ncbi:hypothetical protein LCGC14_2607820, partial [marine sediment metagenome]
LDDYLGFMDLRIKEIYRILKNTGSFYLHCFTPDSKVLMSDFSFRRIDDVKVGEKVFADSSKVEKIEKIWSHNYNGIIKEIKCMGQHVPIKSTPNHLFYVVKKEIRDICKRRFGCIKLDLIMNNVQKLTADELKVGDMLLIPKNVNRNYIISYIKTADFIQTRTSNIRKWIPEKIIFNPRLFRFFGYYLAEGRVFFTSDKKYDKKPSGIDFTININENDIKKDIIEIGKEFFNLDASILDIPERNGCRISFFSTQMGELFLNLFNTGSSKKKICPLILNADDNNLRSLVYGWLKGDGWHYINIEKNINHRIGSSSSICLINQLYLILIRLGEMPRLGISSHKGQNRSSAEKRGFYLRHTNYKVYITKSKKGSPRKHDENYIYTPITEIKDKEYNGIVYNLSIENIHSYQVNYFKVANCDSNAGFDLKILCDEIFSKNNFRREIIWNVGSVSGFKTRAKNWIRQ